MNAAARRGIIAFVCALTPVAKGPELQEKISYVEGRGNTELLKFSVLPDVRAVTVPNDACVSIVIGVPANF